MFLDANFALYPHMAMTSLKNCIGVGNRSFGRILNNKILAK